MHHRIRIVLRSLTGADGHARTAFHNFAPPEKRAAAVNGTAQRRLQRCYSDLTFDLRPARKDGSVDTSERPRDASTWQRTDWVVISFAARDFGSQQVRTESGWDFGQNLVRGVGLSAGCGSNFALGCFARSTSYRALLPSPSDRPLIAL